MEQEVFVAGSTHLFEVVIKDNVNGVVTPMTLTGATIEFKVLKADGTVSTWAATADPDQVTNKGKCTYKLSTTDLTQEGSIYVQPVVTVGADVYRGADIEHFVKRKIV